MVCGFCADDVRIWLGICSGDLVRRSNHKFWRYARGCVGCANGQIVVSLDLRLLELSSASVKLFHSAATMPKMS